MGVRRSAPVPVFPTPGESYVWSEEAQFRLSVQRAYQELYRDLTDASTATPVALASGDSNNVDVNVADLVRFSANAGGSAVTGLAGGYPSRRIVLVNLANTLTLEHEDTASSASNRIISATGAAISLAANDMAELIYDEVGARWRVMGTAV